MSSTVQPRSRNAVSGDAQAEQDAATSESLVFYNAVVFGDDFIGPGHTTIPTQGSPATGYPWVSRVVKTSGSPSVAMLANYSGGAVRCLLDTTSEAQEATFYANDQLNWDMTKTAQFEARLSTHVVPSGAGVEAVFGLMAAWASGPDNNAYYARFQMTGNGNVNYQTKDGVNTLSNSSGVVATVDTFHIYRIDATNPANVRFFIDGVEVSTTGQMTFAATGANAVLQPYFSVYKASGANSGAIDIDKVDLGMNRS